MKIILAMLFSVSAAWAGEECAQSPAFLNISKITYTAPQLSGDFEVTYIFPDLPQEESDCYFDPYTKSYEVRFYHGSQPGNPIQVLLKRNGVLIQTDTISNHLLFARANSSQPYQIKFGEFDSISSHGVGLYSIKCDANVASEDLCKDDSLAGYFYDIRVELKPMVRRR